MPRTTHKTLDPLTGNCLDCGARREEMDDNIYPVCEKIEGPHRLAIIAVRRAERHAFFAAQFAERHLKQAEAEAVGWSKELRQRQADVKALQASLDYLKGDKPETLSVAEAILRTGAAASWNGR